MIRRRQDFLGGVLNTPMLIDDTTMSSSQLAAMRVITSGVDFMPITINPNAENNAGIPSNPEVVYVTEHTAGATTATILRAQEGTVAVAWDYGKRWVNAPTKSDFDAFTLTYIWDGTSYVLSGSARTFIGPEDPGAHGITLQDGDRWEKTT